MRRAPTARPRIRTAVARLIDELDRADTYSGDCRYHDVVQLLGTIDWGAVPLATVRRVFDVIGSEVPLAVLRRGAHGERGGVAGEASRKVRYNAALRRELGAEDRPRRAVAPRSAVPS